MFTNEGVLVCHCMFIPLLGGVKLHGNINFHTDVDQSSVTALASIKRYFIPNDLFILFSFLFDVGMSTKNIITFWHLKSESWIITAVTRHSKNLLEWAVKHFKLIRRKSRCFDWITSYFHMLPFGCLNGLIGVSQLSWGSTVVWCFGPGAVPSSCVGRARPTRCPEQDVIVEALYYCW